MCTVKAASEIRSSQKEYKNGSILIPSVFRMIRYPRPKYSWNYYRDWLHCIEVFPWYNFIDIMVFGHRAERCMSQMLPTGTSDSSRNLKIMHATTTEEVSRFHGVSPYPSWLVCVRASRHQNLAPTFPWIDNCRDETKLLNVGWSTLCFLSKQHKIYTYPWKNHMRIELIDWSYALMIERL